MDKIVTHHAADPLASMHVSMPDDGRLLALSGLAPEMNALNISTLDAFTSREDFGVLGEGALEILQELGVLLEAVVGLEVGFVGLGELDTVMSARSYERLVCHQL